MYNQLLIRKYYYENYCFSNLCKKKRSIESTPAFGFAKLNDTGRQIADSFGYPQHSYLKEDLFKRQGFFERNSALTTALNNGADFQTLCTDYGCSKNGKANAEFIRTQILSPKSASALKGLSEDSRSAGLKSLFENNYDNPELTKKETDALLGLISERIEPTQYAQYAGLIKVGALGRNQRRQDPDGSIKAEAFKR